MVTRDAAEHKESYAAHHMDGQRYVPTGASISRSLPWTAGSWAGVAILAGSAAVFTASAGGQGADGVGVAILRATMVGAPLAAALYAWHLPPYRRFAQVLLLVGFTSLLTVLSESPDPTLYSVGRIAGWFIEVQLVYLLVSFPTGRPRARVDTLLAQAMAAIVVVLYLPTALIGASYPVPTTWTSCVSDCPDNAFFLLAEQPAIVAPMRMLGALSVLGVMIAVLVRLRRSALSASPLSRQVLVPVVVVGALRVLCVGVVLVSRDWLSDPGDTSALRASAWLIAALTPAIALAFLFGLARARLHADEVVWRLATRAQDAPDAETLRAVIAEAIGDQTIEIVFPSACTADAWQDTAGQHATLPDERSGRRAYVVQDRDRVIAAIVYDERLGVQPELLATVSSLAALALDRQRATVARQAAVAATEAERRRIERDLHDGAQQRLIALRIELGLVEAMTTKDPQLAAAQIRNLQGAVEDALAELRALAHGAAPPALAAGGLEGALRELAGRCPLATSVSTRDLGRYAVDVETAVYFCVAEALQNAAKHAVNAGQALVDVRDVGGALLFVVSDDGRGDPRASITTGEGIANMRQRVAALDGALDVSRPPGGGVEVRGSIPLPVDLPTVLSDEPAVA